MSDGIRVLPRLTTATVKRMMVEDEVTILFFLREHGERPKPGTLRIQREGPKLYLEWEEET